MGRSSLGRRLRKVRNRDGVLLCAATSILLFVGELTNAVLKTVINETVETQPNALFAAGALILVFLAYTSAFGAFLAIVAGVLFAHNHVPRGRFFLGLGVGFSLIGLISKFSLSALQGNWNFILWLATTFTGSGVLCGVVAQIVMGHHAMALKKRWRKLRKLQQRNARAKGQETPPNLLSDH